MKKEVSKKKSSTKKEGTWKYLKVPKHSISYESKTGYAIDALEMEYEYIWIPKSCIFTDEKNILEYVSISINTDWEYGTDTEEKLSGEEVYKILYADHEDLNN